MVGGQPSLVDLEAIASKKLKEAILPARDGASVASGESFTLSKALAPICRAASKLRGFEKTLLRERTLLGAPGTATRNKKLIETRIRI